MLTLSILNVCFHWIPGNDRLPRTGAVRLVGSPIVFVFSFISARSANKGVSGSLSDWLPAGTPDASVPRAPPQQMDPSRFTPPPSPSPWMHAPQWLSPTAAERASWPRSLSLTDSWVAVTGRRRRRKREEVKEEENQRAWVPGFGEPKDDLQKSTGIRQRRRCS